MFCMVNTVQSQTYFSKRYSIDNSLSAIGFNAIENDSGYLMVGGYAPYTPAGAVGIIQTDFEGNVLFEKNYKDSSYSYFVGGQSSLQKLSDGGYIMYGTKQKLDTSNLNYDVLYRFNNQAEIIWTKTFGDTSLQNGYSGRIVKETLDGGFICIGHDGNTPVPIWMVKTDSLGNKEWENHPGHPYFCQALDLAICSNGGYIYTGECWSNGPGDEQICVTKVDSVGNLIFHKSFGENLKYDKGFGIIETQDGGFAVCGGYRTTVRWYPFVLKLNNNGDSLWINKITPLSVGNGYNYLHAITELENGDLVSAGNNAFSDGVSFSRYHGLIVKLTADGSLVWQREHNTATTNTSDSYIYDIRVTSDGGFICSGFGTSPQEMWLLKLDSLGCADTACALATTVEETKEISFGDFKVYPNPAHSFITVELQHPISVVSFKLIDLTGKQVLTQKLNTSYTQINIHELPRGIYFYELISEKERYSGKLVIQ